MLNIRKLRPWPNHSWEIDGETVETVSDFILGASKITAVSLMLNIQKTKTMVPTIHGK